jgi:hypothetical protein
MPSEREIISARLAGLGEVHAPRSPVCLGKVRLTRRGLVGLGLKRSDSGHIGRLFEAAKRYNRDKQHFRLRKRSLFMSGLLLLASTVGAWHAVIHRRLIISMVVNDY